MVEVKKVLENIRENGEMHFMCDALYNYDQAESNPFENTLEFCRFVHITKLSSIPLFYMTPAKQSTHTHTHTGGESLLKIK